MALQQALEASILYGGCRAGRHHIRSRGRTMRLCRSIKDAH